MAYHHVSVLLQEALANLALQPGNIYVDGTLGGAGHAKAIARCIMPGGMLIGMDRDPDAIANARRLQDEYSTGVHLFQASFDTLPRVFDKLAISGADGILLDLGISRHQLLDSGRGFSFQLDEPLDMRMDPTRGTTAANLVNQLPEADLRRIMGKYGEEPRAGRISQAIVAARKKEPITTSRQLAELVVRAKGSARRPGVKRIHPATQVFMALRIAVNDELETIARVMAKVDGWLNPKGRLCVIAFHSLEDRIVKHGLRALAQGCRCPKELPRCVCGHTPTMRLVTKKAIRPGAAEIAANPLARSALLRVAEKI